MSDIALKLRIHGAVQGVGYRNWMIRAARRQGIDGWVRNRVDNTVEALVIGEESKIRDLIKQCYAGPPSAGVSRIEETPAEGVAPRGVFERKPTV